MTERSPALRFLEPRQRAELSLEEAERLGIGPGDEVEVSVNGLSIRATVTIRERMRPGTVFLVEGTAEANANALLNGGGEIAAVRKLDPADLVEVVR